jgi:hypothetical protein
LLGAAAALAWTAAFALESRAPAAFDFTGLYASANLVATGRAADVADPEAVRIAMTQLGPRPVDRLNANLPALALIMAPLGALPFGVAYVVMLTASAAALTVAALRLDPAGSPTYLACAALLAPPSLLALAHGQTTPLILMAIVMSRRLHGFAAGMALGAVALRPQILPLFAIAALGDRARFLGFAAVTAVVGVVSLLMIGLDGVPRYIELLLLAARERGIGEVGVAAIAQRLIPTGPSDPALQGLLVSGVALAVGAIVVRRAERRIEVAGVWSPLAAPHALFHDLVLTYPAVARERPALAALIGVSGTAAMLLQLLGLALVPMWLAAVALFSARRGAVP